MAVDFHAHLARPDPEAPPFLRHMFDVEGYLEKQADAGIELTLISYTLSDLEGTPEELERGKAENDHIAGLMADHAGRFGGLAGIDPFGGDGWLELAEQALDSGFSGLCLPTSRQGTYLDAPEAQAALALANERSVPIFLHPSDSAISGLTGNSLLETWIGLPVDTGICLVRMLMADTLSHYPNVRMVVAHSGGVLPALIGRLDPAYDVFKRMHALLAAAPPGGGPGGPAGPAMESDPDTAPLTPSVEGDPPSRRTGQLFLDTANLHPATLKAALEIVGVDRVVLGTDYPPAGESPAAAMQLVNELGLSDEDREKVLSLNARGLLNR